MIDPDAIARILDPDNPGNATLAAGRAALRKGQRFLIEEQSFVRETTLTGRSGLRLAKQAKERGFDFELLYIGIDSWKISCQRVDTRVRLGGHDIPTPDILRRFDRSLANLNEAIGMAKFGIVFDNSGRQHVPVGLIQDGHIEATAADLPMWAHRAAIEHKPVTQTEFIERVRDHVQGRPYTLVIDRSQGMSL